MPHLRIRELDIYFEDTGEGPPLIISHGALGCVAMTRPGLRPMDLAPRGFRVIAYDGRGHGQSGYSTDPASYQRISRADELLSLMDALGVSAAHIVGTSMGASTALAVARRQPQRVLRLVLRAPSPFPADATIARLTLGALAASYQILGAELTAQLGSYASSARSRTRTHGLLASQRRLGVVPMLRGLLSEPFYDERLSEINTPALVVAHRRDRLHPETSARSLRALLPGARLLMADSPGHWEAEPERLTDAIASFLYGHTVPGAA